MSSPRVNLVDLVLRSYAVRACFVCGELGPCRHRQYDVERAYILADVRALRPAPSPQLSLFAAGRGEEKEGAESARALAGGWPPPVELRPEAV